MSFQKDRQLNWKMKARRAQWLRSAVMTATPLVASLAMVAKTHASVINVTSGSSTVTLDTAQGMTGWSINGTSELSSQQFYYRIGAVGGQTLLESNALTGTNTSTPGIATLSYSNTFFTTGISYLLSGGAGNSPSTLNETVDVSNQTASPVTLEFFKYADFDLNGQSANQTVSITNSAGTSTAVQFDASMLVESYTTGQGNTAPPNEVEAGVASTLLGKIDSPTVPYTLDGALTAGPADVAWAYEWDVTLAASGNNGSSLLISIPTTIQPVPEPATIGLGAAGLAMLAMRRKKRVT
jgi:hypothetical protein